MEVAKLEAKVHDLPTPMLDTLQEALEGRRLYLSSSTTDFTISKSSEGVARSGVKAFSRHDGTEVSIVVNGVFTFKDRIDSSALVNIVYRPKSDTVSAQTRAYEPQKAGKDMPEGARRQVATEVLRLVQQVMAHNEGYWKLLQRDAEDAHRQQQAAEFIRNATKNLRYAQREWEKWEKGQ